MTLSITKKIFIGLAMLGVIAFFSFFAGFAQLVKASASFFNREAVCTNTSSLSTTSIAWMTPGTATSTVTCGSFDKAESALLIVQENASSSNSTFNYYVEESTDNIDWYPVTPGLIVLDSMVTSAATASTTLAAQNVQTIVHKFATTTVGGAATQNGTLTGYNGTQNRFGFTATIPVRAQYVRVYATMASSTTGSNGGGNGGVWMQIQKVITQ